MYKGVEVYSISGLCFNVNILFTLFDEETNHAKCG